jgi:hypothetical protein
MKTPAIIAEPIVLLAYASGLLAYASYAGVEDFACKIQLARSVPKERTNWNAPPRRITPVTGTLRLSDP